MTDAELNAVKNKRENEIQKLNNYIASGKTADEKIVQSSIKKIKKCEKTLITNGIELTTTINEDGTFSNIPEIAVTVENSNEQVEETSIDNDTTRQRRSSKPVPKKAMIFNDTPKIEKMGVSIKVDTLNKVNALLPKNSGGKGKINANGIVVSLLESIYDNGEFKVEFEKKAELKVTSYNLPADMIKAINKIHKSTKLPKSEIFERLLETALEEYF